MFLLTGCGNYEEIELDFTHNDNRLSGSIILPKKGIKPYPVVIFVHGDGSTPYDSWGYYNYIWKYLAKKGIASYSWNKAGVQGSTGNWLKQSMEDRADEVIVAIEMLKKHSDIATNRIGLIGYSQGGWVLPLVAKKTAYPDFMILVGGAINWLDQGDYLTKNRLRREGFSNKKIQQALICNQQKLKVLQPTSSYEDYLKYQKNISSECKPFAADKMTSKRFGFVKLNWRSDAREGLAAVRCPTLGIFGDKDINVDFAESIREYKRIFDKSGNYNLTIKTYPSAQHALFRTKYIDSQSPGVWTLIKMEILGEEVFVDGYLEYVAEWVERVTLLTENK